MNALVLLVILCHAVPLLGFWALSKFGPWVLTGLCAWALVIWGVLAFVRSLMRRNSRIFDHFKL